MGVTSVERVGFVVLNYITWEDTVKCVDSIIDSCDFSYKIVVVDNVSPNASYIELKKIFENVRYQDVDIIQSEYNGGFSYGNNYGFKYCQRIYNPEYVIFTNSDILFMNDSVQYLIDDLKTNHNALLVGPLVRNPLGEIVSLPMKSRRTLWDVVDTRGWKRKTFSPDDIQELTKVYWISGCCFAVNAKLFREVGMFDENVFLYEEENILAYKVKEKNYTEWYEPKAEVIHNQGSSTGKGSIFVDQEFLKSTMYYWRVYEDKKQIQILGLWVFYMFKIGGKIVMRRYASNRGALHCVRETFVSMIHISREKK